MVQTDTASVLHEAMGYIRFLQDQIQVLCSPYIHSLPVSISCHTLINSNIHISATETWLAIRPLTKNLDQSYPIGT